MLSKEQIEKTYADKFTVNELGCWIWKGVYKSHRYGQITVNGRKLLIHRYIWELIHGQIPTGMLICHHCDNSYCMNPSHLFLGSYKDNMVDMAKKGRNKFPLYFGERTPSSKLSSSQVEKIRIELKTDTLEKIASKYGVSVRTIFNIKHGICWVKGEHETIIVGGSLNGK